MATVQTQISVGEVKSIVRHAAALAKARARRNAAASALIRSLPREILGMKATLQTLLQARSEEYFDLYLERERILSKWRSENKEIIEELSSSMKDYFKHSEAIADLASRPSVATVLSTLEASE